MAADFLQGDIVVHKGMNRYGKVTRTDPYVEVRYDAKEGQRADLIGKYDNRWFETHHDVLQLHLRSPISAQRK